MKHKLTTAKLHFNNLVKDFNIHFEEIEDFTLVYFRKLKQTANLHSGKSMANIYKDILKASEHTKYSILLDPDKVVLETLSDLILKSINHLQVIFLLAEAKLQLLLLINCLQIKQNSNLPIVLFPGNPSQISDEADAILFLSLISGRNPD
jgi:hypothetical protein